MQQRIADARVPFQSQYEALGHDWSNAEINAKRKKLDTKQGQAVWQVKRNYLNRLHYQTEWVAWFNRLAIGGAYLSLTESLARTDLSAYQRFMEQTRRYRDEHRHLMWLLWADREQYNQEKTRFLQPLQPSAVTLSESIRVGVLDLSLLLLFNALFFMGAHLSFVRYQFS